MFLWHIVLLYSFFSKGIVIKSHIIKAIALII
jgi:hypothetical protein